MDNFDRYRKIVKWARVRYTVNGRLMVMERNRQPAPFIRIERAAARKYLGV